MIFGSRKNKAIKSYLMILPKLMIKDYGRSSEYSALQVIRSLERYSFNIKYKTYAVALHCSNEEFFNYFKNEISDSEYQQLRTEISKKYFDGFEFTSSDVSKYSIMFSGYNYSDNHSEGDIMIDGDGD